MALNSWGHMAASSFHAGGKRQVVLTFSLTRKRVHFTNIWLIVLQMKPQTVRIVKKEPLEALKEVGYSEREHSGVINNKHFVFI